MWFCLSRLQDRIWRTDSIYIIWDRRHAVVGTVPLNPLLSSPQNFQINGTKLTKFLLRPCILRCIPINDNAHNVCGAVWQTWVQAESCQEAYVEVSFSKAEVRHLDISTKAFMEMYLIQQERSIWHTFVLGELWKVCFHMFWTALFL